MRQVQTVVNGVEVAAEVAGEARKRSQGVALDTYDPLLEPVAEGVWPS
jgi:hypothetical protein